MVSPTSLFDVETAGLHGRPSWSADGPGRRGIVKQRSARRADLLFAFEVLRRLREGVTPSRRALECSGFVEHWIIEAHDDVCVLEGAVWRLPFSLSTIATPLLAIDPVAGWARTVDEWLTIRPCLSSAGPAIHPASVAERAARWLERQLQPDDGGEIGLAQN